MAEAFQVIVKILPLQTDNPTSTSLNKEVLTQEWTESIICLLVRRLVALTTLIVEACHVHQLHTTFHPKLLQIVTPWMEETIWIISVDFDVIRQLITKCAAPSDSYLI